MKKITKLAGAVSGALLSLLLLAMPVAAEEWGSAFAQPLDPDAQEVAYLVDEFCMPFLGHGNELASALKEAGGKPVPSAAVLAFMAGESGATGYSLKGDDGSMYMVSYSSTPSCVVAAPTTKGEATVSLFASWPRRLLIADEVIFGQRQQVFTALKHDRVEQKDKRMVIVATTSPKGAAGVVFKVMPEQVAKAAGMPLDKWPQ